MLGYMESDAYRAASVRALQSKGLSIPGHLPLIEKGQIRTSNETVLRLLCLHACAASSYGFQKAKAIAWGEQEGLSGSFEEQELNFLSGRDAGSRFRYQVEGMAVLCWALGYEDDLDWFQGIDDKFVARLPDLRRGRDSHQLRSGVRPRSSDEVMAATDLAYCLHWLSVESGLSSSSARLPFENYVPTERRRALDWLTGTES